jgi:hypothetical protein
MTSKTRRDGSGGAGAVVYWLVLLVGIWTVSAEASRQATSNPSTGHREKPNIAISGCLMRQGYATLVVADAHVDGRGDAVDRAQPGGADNGLKGVVVPAKWVLDDAGPVTQHVGEKVQVIGSTDWTAADKPADDGAVGMPAPHVSVTSVKVIASTCS